MKKLLTIILVMTMILLCLTSCDFTLKHEHIKGDWEYNETQHWQNVKCSWGTCKINIVAFDHLDENGDLHCDTCGFETAIAHFDKEWHYSETHHWWLPKGEVSLGVVYGYEEHTSIDGDYYCDVCRYDLVDQLPPQPLLREQSGCEWLNQISAEDIVKVEITSECVGVPPGSLKLITATVDEKEITAIFKNYYELNVFRISREEGAVCGGSRFTVKFVLNNGASKQLYINNGNYRDTYGNYYELLCTPKLNEGNTVTKAYGFISFSNVGTVYTSLPDFPDEETIWTVDGICELQFVECEYSPECAPTHFIFTDFGRLEIYGNVYFAYDGEYFCLVNGDFYDMLEIEGKIKTVK